MSESAQTKMSPEQIADQIELHPEWPELNEQISRTLSFDDFAGSIAFVNKVAAYAERVEHHPDILIRYDKVTLTVSTHDANGITMKDFELATAVAGFIEE